jgi:hypothetical protein
MRVFDPVDGVAPTSKRIIQDIDKTIDAMQEILTQRGVYVPGLAGGRVPGHRNRSVGDTDKRGGKRTYQPFVDGETGLKDIHEDLRSLLQECQIGGSEAASAWKQKVSEAEKDEADDEEDFLHDDDASDGDEIQVAPM